MLEMSIEAWRSVSSISESAAGDAGALVVPGAMTPLVPSGLVLVGIAASS
jgi:hypothetical protein